MILGMSFWCSIIHDHDKIGTFDARMHMHVVILLLNYILVAIG